MAYKSDTIAVITKRLNSQYFLPAIQREFVWKPDQVCQLFDSILRGYPISSFLFWELTEENRDKWEAYKFIDHARHGGTHNEIAHTDGVKDSTLILDGQQRLTSLLIGLKGAYTVKKKYKRKKDPSAYSKQQLFLNLLKDPKLDEDDEADGDMGLRYGLQFFEKRPQNTDSEYWFKLGRILDFDSDDDFDEFKDDEAEKLPDSVTKGKVRVFKRNLDRLFRATWKDDVIAYYTEMDQNYDRVLDIFVRANEGGTKLSKSDLLLSMVTSKWDGMNAREEIFDFLDRINTDLTRKNNFDKDFLMKTCLVLTDLPVAYKVKNFTNTNLALIQNKWDEIKNAIEKTVDLVNTCGIDGDTLTSANALVPIIYYFFTNPNIDLRGQSTPFAAKNIGAIRRWLVLALLNNVFSGQSDNTLRDARKALQENGHTDDFPADEINAIIIKAGRNAYFEDYTIDNVLDLTYNRSISFLALSLLYDENSWGVMQYHKDHIFPQSSLTFRALVKQGVPVDEAARLNSFKDRLGNLSLIVANENMGKLDTPFEDWIRTRDASYIEKHLIPNDPELWKFENFEQFLKAREELIRKRLIDLFGKPVNTTE